MWLIQLLYKLATVTVWFWGKDVASAAFGQPGHGGEAFLIAFTAQMLISFVMPRFARRTESALVRALLAPRWPKFRPLTESEIAAFHAGRNRRRHPRQSVLDINPATGLSMTACGLDVGGNAYGFRDHEH